MKGVFLATWLLALCLAAAEATPDQLLNKTHDEKIAGKIINGRDANPGQFPWQAYILMQDATGALSECSGSLIHPGWILTAAHCTEGVINYTIRLGSLSKTSGGIIIQVVNSNVFVHEGFNKVDWNSDIALIKLPGNVQQTKTIMAIKLIPDHYEYYGTMQISGWGKTSDEGNTPADNLKYINVVQQSFEDCKKFYPFMTPQTMCTLGTGADILQSPCSGDSGGPVTIPIGPASEWPVLAAIVSFSLHPCTLGYPAGQLRVKPYRQWIRNRVKALL